MRWYGNIFSMIVYDKWCDESLYIIFIYLSYGILVRV